MRKRALILATLILTTFCLSRLDAQNKIQIQADKKESVNVYGISEFYFVHQVFADAFFMADLNKQLNYDEMTEILKSVLFKVDKDHKVTVVVKQREGPDAKLVFFIKEGTKEGTLLAMMTNFHQEKRKFTKDLDENKSLTRWYFIKGDKLVYRQDLYSEQTESKKKGEEPHALIDYYLFDNNVENDVKVKGLIDEVLNNEASDKVEVLYAKLYLGEFYLLNADFANAEREVQGLKAYFNQFKNNGIPSQYELIVNMAETELALVKRICK